MKPNSSIPARFKKPQTHIIHFTAAEERAIAQAADEARLFMESYGKGRSPYLIDLRYYEPGAVPDIEPSPEITEVQNDRQ